MLYYEVNRLGTAHQLDVMLMYRMTNLVTNPQLLLQ